MAEVLFDEELSKKFGMNGRRLIQEKYNWDMINEQILNIYESII
jgi:glycosyltransferase involved in cell wall biosynthesis